MTIIDRRDFLKKSGVGMAALSTAGLWADRLFADATPPTSSFFTERYGISHEDMKKILHVALSKGGDFSELFFEYTVNNTVVMEEGIVKTASETSLWEWVYAYSRTIRRVSPTPTTSPWRA